MHAFNLWLKKDHKYLWNLDYTKWYDSIAAGYVSVHMLSKARFRGMCSSTLPAKLIWQYHYAIYSQMVENIEPYMITISLSYIL